ncbi:hypothetical protein BDW62DRAFT_60661 [Aspergillus aurantiobrunneus]
MSEMMSVVKIPHCRGFGAVGSPREIRDALYTYAIPRATLQYTSSGFVGLALSRAIADPSGFYYPFRSDLGLLAVNKQVREEALGIAYRKSFVQLEDMDDFIVFAISIGKIGQGNVESMSFTWESKSDPSSTGGVWDSDSDPIKLPVLHTTRYIQLSEHFRRLGYLRLSFDDYIISKLSTSDFQNDAGIQTLRQTSSPCS